jgi:hypothetical protein
MTLFKQFTFVLWICSSYSNYYWIIHQDIINHGETCFNVDILLYKIFIANTHYVSGSCATIYPAQNESQAQVNWKVPWNSFEGVKRLKVNAGCFLVAYLGGMKTFQVKMINTFEC